jgi:hypothetical protein
VRQVFVLSAVAQAPRYQGTVLKKIASNWTLSPIVTVRSNTWFSVTTGQDNALSGQSNEVPNLVGSIYPANQTPNHWINASAFQNPATGTIGNLGLMSIKGPNFFDWDVSLARTFGLRGDKQTLQVRADFFNLTNHANFNTPTATLNSSTFGQILSANDPRILQFAAKIVF